MFSFSLVDLSFPFKVVVVVVDVPAFIMTQLRLGK